MEQLSTGAPTRDATEPYGSAPLLLGIAATDLHHWLCDVPVWSEDRRWRWVNTDHFALHSWEAIELHMIDALTEPEMSSEQVSAILGLMSDFHVTLPFDEAESNWLLGAYDEAYGAGAIGRIRRRKPEQIVSCGLRRVIDSRDLLRRWWAWRRETDEFRGQGTLEVARESLRALAATLAPSQNVKIPESYLARHGTPTPRPNA